jgi:uncharacterized membrane-anchored protein
VSAAILIAVALLAAPPATKALASVALVDPAGDVEIYNGSENARDIVKLDLSSDGTQLLVSATLAQDERGALAGTVLELMSFRTLDIVASNMGAEKAPIAGRLVSGGIPYGYLGLKPGQVVRILAREADASNDAAPFPEVRLALK